MPGLERIGVRHSRTFLLRAHQCLQLCPIEMGPKWHGLLGTRLSWCTLGTEEPLGHKNWGGGGGGMERPDGKTLFVYGCGKRPDLVRS
jgi:hypothetical protein